MKRSLKKIQYQGMMTGSFNDKDLDTAQSKIRDVLGSIWKLCTIIEKVATQENSEETDIQISLEDISRLIPLCC